MISTFFFFLLLFMMWKNFAGQETINYSIVFVFDGGDPARRSFRKITERNRPAQDPGSQTLSFLPLEGVFSNDIKKSIRAFSRASDSGSFFNVGLLWDASFPTKQRLGRSTPSVTCNAYISSVVKVQLHPRRVTYNVCTSITLYRKLSLWI